MEDFMIFLYGAGGMCTILFVKKIIEMRAINIFKYWTDIAHNEDVDKRIEHAINDAFKEKTISVKKTKRLYWIG